jgi:hypothetical protein
MGYNKNIELKSEDFDFGGNLLHPVDLSDVGGSLTIEHSGTYDGIIFFWLPVSLPSAVKVSGNISINAGEVSCGDFISGGGQINSINSIYALNDIKGSYGLNCGGEIVSSSGNILFSGQVTAARDIKAVGVTSSGNISANFLTAGGDVISFFANANKIEIGGDLNVADGWFGSAYIGRNAYGTLDSLGDFTVRGNVFPGIQSGFGGGGGIVSSSGNLNIGKNCYTAPWAPNGNINIGGILNFYSGYQVTNSAYCKGIFSASGIAGNNADITAASIIIDGYANCGALHATGGAIYCIGNINGSGLDSDTSSISAGNINASYISAKSFIETTGNLYSERDVISRNSWIRSKGNITSHVGKVIACLDITAAGYILATGGIYAGVCEKTAPEPTKIICQNISGLNIVYGTPVEKPFSTSVNSPYYGLVFGYVTAYDGKNKKVIPIKELTNSSSLFVFSIDKLAVPNTLLIDFVNLEYFGSNNFLVKSCETQFGTFNTEKTASPMGGNHYFVNFQYTGANYFQIYLP